MILSINGKDPSPKALARFCGVSWGIGALAGSFDSRSRLRRLASIVIRRSLIATRMLYSIAFFYFSISHGLIAVSFLVLL